VGKLEVAETSGLNQGLLNIVKNNILITENTEYASSNTWGIKLPTTWVAEFDVKGHSTTKYVEFNFYNEDKTSNTSGYTLNFKDTSLTLKYDNGTTLASATIPTIVNTYRKVNIFFERNVIAVSIDGTRYLYDKRPSVLSRVISTTGSAFVNVFIEENAANSKFKNLRIVNGRFISDQTSNIAFIGGNLGVGVNSPQEALDIRGNMHFNRVSNVSSVSVDSNVVAEYTGPHDRPLRKYPEVAMTSASQSGYVVSASSNYINFPFLDDWRAFNGVTGNEGWNSAPPTGSTYDSTDDFLYNGVNSLGTVSGEWLKLELPTKIRLSQIVMTARNTSNEQQPEDFQILGSNDNSNWTQLMNVIGASFTQGSTLTFHVTGNVDHFKYLAIVVTRTKGHAIPAFSELEYYGYEEGSGSLDTALKTVYNVPATTGTQLEVYYDAKDLADGTVTSVVDSSPNTNTGTPANITVSDGAFVFNGTSSLIEKTSMSIPGGDKPLTFSFWLKSDDFLNNQYILRLGDNTTSLQTLAIYKGNNNGQIIFASFTLDFPIDYTFISGQWNHISLVYPGGGWKQSNMIAYVDGKPYGFGENASVGGVGGGGLSLATSLTLRLGGFATGNAQLDGSIANFRLFSKALNADQVKELYDYQKDYFLGSKSQVTLYKGHLGVGVTEPSGQLELAGDERIQEYPPRDMTGYETLVEGHGVFCVSASDDMSQVGATGYGSTKAAWYAFMDGNTASGNQDEWVSSYDRDDGTAGTIYDIGSGDSANSYNTARRNRQLGSVYGEWGVFKSPYPIKIQSIDITVDHTWSQESARRYTVLGSNDGNTWEIIRHVQSGDGNGTTLAASTSPTAGLVQNGLVNSTKYYTHTGIVVTQLSNYQHYFRIPRIRLFGTPGPTTLDKGSLTLGRSLDVPRVSRYDVDTETPRPEKLVVDFDTTVNRFPIDISGNFNDGTLHNSSGAPTYSQAEKAFDFDGVNGVIYSGTLSPVMTGDRICSMSAWFKTTNASSVHQTVMWLGHYSASSLLTVAVSNGALRISIGDTCKMEVAGVIESNRWYHVVGIKAGTGAVTSSNFSSIFKLYLNGKQLTGTFGGQSRQLNVTTNYWYIGAGNTTGAEHFDGYISNPKLYNTILEPSEVKKLYNLGRTGRSMVISDTAVGIGKAPEAQLDVRGVTRFDGRVGIGTNVPNFALHIHGNNKGVTAITGNQWINWLTNPNYNGTYNGDSPSYPVTTHASMTNTGVYSRHSIGCSGYLWSHGSTLNMSDRRVKTNIVDANDDTCLRTLRQLKPKQYNYINIRERGSDPVWGFIAQEVKEAIPYSTTLKTDYIPNIDEKARLLDDGRTIVFTNFNTASLESNATTIRIMNKNQEEIDITLTDVLDPNTIRVKENITEHTFVYDQEDDNGNMLEGNYVYVYGQEIDDFVYLKKDAIWTVTTAALQEVDRQLQYERARNDALEARVTVLEQAKYM
jgi:hypothetical protein